MGKMVTRKASVMTPLLILNAVILVFAVTVYWRSENLILIYVWIPVLVFTLVYYARFAEKMPWMLSGEEVQTHGMNLTMGDSKKQISDFTLDTLRPTANPAPEGIEEGQLVTEQKPEGVDK